jgi:CRP/FNR family transcriptional regulator, cyclic AMP receptor protein
VTVSLPLRSTPRGAGLHRVLPEHDPADEPVEWPVLAGLTPEHRRRVLAAARRRRFRRGEVVFHHGDPADAFHLVERGRVAVRATSPRGAQLLLSVLGPGRSFGELALVGERTPRSATITALEPTETLVLHRLQFEQLRAHQPSVDRYLVAALAAQVASLSEQLMEVVFLPTRLRVVRTLLVLEREYGGVIRMTQEDVGLMAGTTRPTVNETLREIERTGAIRVGRGRIEVLDPAALARRLARVAG